MPIIVNKEEKVKEICLKAYTQFVEKGIDNFSLNQFVRSSGISKGQFYHYFKTKEDLVFEVMSHKTLELFEMLDIQLKDATTVLEKLLISFSVYISEDEESINFRKMMFDSFHIYIHSSESKIREYNQVLYQLIDEKLISLFDDVDVKNSPALIKSISATADGMYLRSLMVDSYDLKNGLSQYLTLIVPIIEKDN